MAYNPVSLPLAPASYVDKQSAHRDGYRALALLAFAHFFIDLYSSALSSFQPVLVTRFGLSLAQAGLLAGALIFSSSLLQPMYGILSDRTGSRWFNVLAPAVAGIFISCLGLANGYGVLVAIGICVAARIASVLPQTVGHATARISDTQSD